MRLRWVCRWSQGQRARRVRTSSANRTSSAATGSASAGIHRQVRWSGSNARSRSAQATVDDGLVGQPETLEHRHLGPVVDEPA